MRVMCLLWIVARVNDFDWRLSSDCLSRARFAPIVVQGPFEDVLLKMPVRGERAASRLLSASCR